MKSDKQENDWPHNCKTCPVPIEKEDAIDIGPDKNNMPLDWYSCPTCGNCFAKNKGVKDETK